MSEPLRPMSTGELLDRTFSLYRSHFMLFVGIAAVAPAIYMVFQILTVVVSASAELDRVGGAAAAAFAVVTAIGIVAALIGWVLGLALTQAATVRAVSAVHLSRPTSMHEAYASLRGKYLRIIGVFLSVMIRVGGGAAILVLLAVLVGSLAVGAGMTLGTGGIVAGAVVALAATIAAVILAVTLFVRYSLAVQACVVEDISVGASLKRSAFLVKGSRNRILTVYTLFVVLNWVIGGFLFVFVTMMGVLVRSVIVTQVSILLATFVAGALTSPLPTIAMSLVYYDERVRKEAFDLQLMMAGIDAQAAAAGASS